MENGFLGAKVGKNTHQASVVAQQKMILAWSRMVKVLEIEGRGQHSNIEDKQSKITEEKLL